MKTRPANHRFVRAISPVISVLLMIVIAVAASLVAYAWVMGYLGGTTQKVDNAILIQNVQPATAGGDLLVIYVQNVGNGLVHLKQDSSVYVNDVLHKITNSPKNNQTELATGELLTVQKGETKELVIDYLYSLGDRLRIKVVTIEGTLMEITVQGTRTTPPETPQFVFADGFENGDLAWSVKIGDITVQNTIKRSGTYAAMADTPYLERFYKTGLAAFSNLRCYVYFVDLPTSGNVLSFMEGYNGVNEVVLAVRNNAGTYEWGIYWYNQQWSELLEPTTGRWYCVELQMTAGSHVDVYVDGQLILTQENTGYVDFEGVVVGGWDKSEALTNYIDDVVVANAYIGP